MKDRDSQLDELRNRVIEDCTDISRRMALIKPSMMGIHEIAILTGVAAYIKQADETFRFLDK